MKRIWAIHQCIVKEVTERMREDCDDQWSVLWCHTLNIDSKFALSRRCSVHDQLRHVCEIFMGQPMNVKESGQTEGEYRSGILAYIIYACVEQQYAKVQQNLLNDSLPPLLLHEWHLLKVTVALTIWAIRKRKLQSVAFIERFRHYSSDCLIRGFLFFTG